MEVSSHALALGRVEGTTFAAGVFTNLTRDHLDFHEDMDRYFAAKRRLFEMLPEGAPSVVNVDDPRGAQLASQFAERDTLRCTEKAHANAFTRAARAFSQSEHRADRGNRIDAIGKAKRKHHRP